MQTERSPCTPGPATASLCGAKRMQPKPFCSKSVVDRIALDGMTVYAESEHY